MMLVTCLHLGLMLLYLHSLICLHGMLLNESQGQFYCLPKEFNSSGSGEGPVAGFFKHGI